MSITTNEALAYWRGNLFAAMQTKREAVREGNTELAVIANERIAYSRTAMRAVDYIAKTGVPPSEAFAFFGLQSPRKG